MRVSISMCDIAQEQLNKWQENVKLFKPYRKFSILNGHHIG